MTTDTATMAHETSGKRQSLCYCGRVKSRNSRACRECYREECGRMRDPHWPALLLELYWPIHMARLSQRRMTTRPKDVAA